MVMKRGRKFPLTKHLEPLNQRVTHFSSSATLTAFTASDFRAFFSSSFRNDKTSTQMPLSRPHPLPTLHPDSPLPLHRATSPTVAKLEKLRNEAGIGSWGNILLQYKHLVRRRTSMFAPLVPRINSPGLITNPPVAVPPPNSPSDETSLPTLESVKSYRQEKYPPPTPPPESTKPETLEEREQQASQEGAFNEETGEIHWDCPCLGGMAHGPCGEQFRGAFSCFVYSKAEPKGMDCIDNFK